MAIPAIFVFTRLKSESSFIIYENTLAAKLHANGCKDIQVVHIHYEYKVFGQGGAMEY